MSRAYIEDITNRVELARRAEKRETGLHHLLVGVISEDAIAYLIKNGFCTAPASSTWHGAYEGGLYDHSLNVTQQLVNYTDKLGLKWQRKGCTSPIIVGMLHDLCKIDLYIKNSGFNEYSRNNEVLIQSHAEKSLIYALRHVSLNDEEIACIRFHMGAYETNDWKQFDRAIKQYPNVLYTHTADMFASKLMEE